MGIFSRFPYTDFHRLNADWILDKVKESAEAVAESLGLVRQSAADASAAAEAAQQAAGGCVRYDGAQQLSQAQQAQARDNIRAAPSVGVVRYDVAMGLDVNNQARARDNIGAATDSELQILNSQVVKTVSQELTELQQGRARANIGAASADDLDDVADIAAGAVRYDAVQELTSTQQAAARANIGAAAEGSGPAPVGAVLYDQAQSLTAAQKIQARANIGALRVVDPSVSNLYITEGNQDIQIYSDDPATGPVLILEGSNQGSSGLDVQISGVAAPTSGNDAVNKDYADSIRGPLLSNIAGDDVILQPDASNAKQSVLYVCTAEELNSLEIIPIAAPAANREFTVRFTSGATPTELDTPLTILGLDDLVPAANTIYEINVLGNLAVWHSWEVPTT